MTDRPADVWEALLAIADLAGGDWPQLAREACLAFVTGAKDDTESTGTHLLADLRDVFGDAEALWVDDILSRLRALDEVPWGNWSGHPLTARELAKLLKQYQAVDGGPVKSRQVRVGDTNRRGYRRADLHDAWSRYLSSPSATSATSATGLVRHVADVADVAEPEGPKAQEVVEPEDNDAGGQGPFDLVAGDDEAALRLVRELGGELIGTVEVSVDRWHCHCGLRLFDTAETAPPAAWARHLAHVEMFRGGK